MALSRAIEDRRRGIRWTLGCTVCSDEEGGLTSTSDRELVKLEGPLQNCDPCAEAETTAEERRLRSTALSVLLYGS